MMTPWFDGRKIPSEEIQIETRYFWFLSRPQEVLDGSGIIVPKQYVTNPFALTAEEWSDLRVALHQARSWLDERQEPDGYNIGWNVGAVAGQEVEHLHLHIIPRHADEPLAGRGIRYWLKQSGNKRPRP